MYLQQSCRRLVYIPLRALGAVADGISIITENIFETRFKQIPEFRKMGAIVDIKGRTAIFEGVPKLYGAEVKAEDLRGGASLVLMGLFASGTTVVHDITKFMLLLI